jgi:hypothetical protein
MNYEQAFAIVGVNISGALDIQSGLEGIAVEKIVWTREVAESEVSRLNRSREGTGAFYFWTLTRVEQR